MCVRRGYIILKILLTLLDLCSAGKGRVVTRWPRTYITCDEENPTLESFSNGDGFNRGLTGAILKIGVCPLPAVSFLDSLPWLGNSTLTELELRNTPELSEAHMAGLTVMKLSITLPGVEYVFRNRNEGPKEIISEEHTELRIYCNDANFVYSNKSAIYLAKRIHIVLMFGCPLPTDSYVAALTNLNIRAKSLTELTLILLSSFNSILRPEHFTGLAIRALKIESFNVKIMYRPQNNFLEPLVLSLRELSVKQIELPPLPAATKVVNMTLVDGKSVGALGGCTELRRLTIVSWDVSIAAGAWLAHCPQLGDLEVTGLQTEMVQPVLTGARSLSSVTFTDCLLSRLSNIIADALSLRKLTVVESKLTLLNGYDYLNFTLLEELNFTSNQLDVADSLGFISALKALRSVTFDQNCCWSAGDDLAYILDLFRRFSPPNLTHVSMYQVGLPAFIFGPWNTHLSHLNLSGNEIHTLEFSKFPIPRSGHLDIDLRGNPIEVVNVTEEDYYSMKKIFGKENSSLTVLTDAMSLECDCANVWFAWVLRAVPSVRAPGARCAGGGLLRDVPVGQLECDRDSCGNCTCRREWRDNATSASCVGDVYAVPRVPHLRALYANGSRIGTLQVADLPKTLELVDLRNNMISRLTAEVATALFEVRERRVRLSGNPLVCDCDNRPLVEALQAHRTQVEDFNLLSCIYGLEQVALRDVQADTLCKTRRERVVLVVSVIVSLAAFAGVTALLCYRYRLIIKMFLYARGCCLFCVREDEVDADRLYDAFVSFAHEDEEVVEEELLPGLEHEYKLCVHTRNWMPGLMINTQIVNSVDQSRRTIIVLSRNFVASIWGMLEFRTAYMSAMSEGRVRVIVVVLDDVLDDENLDPELRSYVRTYTYLKFRDRWFWQKLRYALPHHRHRADRSEGVTIEVQARGSAQS